MKRKTGVEAIETEWEMGSVTSCVQVVGPMQLRSSRNEDEKRKDRYGRMVTTFKVRMETVMKEPLRKRSFPCCLPRKESREKSRPVNRRFWYESR